MLLLVKEFMNTSYLKTKCRATVIIVNWNGKELLSDTLFALQLQTFYYFRTIIIDNASTDGSKEYIRKFFPNIELIEMSWNSGFAIANNVALKKIISPYTVLLNNDAVPAKEWLRNLIKALDENPQAGFAASKMLYYDNPGVIDRVGDAYTTAGVAQLRGRKEPASCYSKPGWIFGACAGAAIYRTDVLREVNFFDEDYFLINEDVDLSFRLQLRGYKCLYVPDAIVFHKASSSIVHDSQMSVYYGHRNLEWVYLKNMPFKLIVKTLPAHLLYIIIAFFYFLIKGHGVTYLKAKKDALIGFLKMLKKRREIQKKRCVNTKYIASIMDPENFLNRKKIHQ